MHVLNALLFSNFAFAEIEASILWVGVLEFQQVSHPQTQPKQEHSLDTLLYRLSNRARTVALETLPSSDYSLLTKDNILEILSDNGVNAVCTDSGCAVQTGRTLGADWIVQGEVLVDDSLYTSTLQLYNTQSSELISMTEVTGQTPESLLTALDGGVRLLLNNAMHASTVRTSKTKFEPLSTVSIDRLEPFTFGCTPIKWKQLANPLLPVFPPDTIHCTDNTTPAAIVHLTQEFEITKHPVTISEWNATIANSPNTTLQTIASTHWSTDLSDYPAQNMTWLDTIVFANLRSEMENLSPCYTMSGDSVSIEPSCTGWRLPTEKEWEYAMRGTAHHSVAWTGSMGHAWNVPVSKTGPVCQRTGNDIGICDTTDSIWEWVWDWSAPYVPKNTSIYGPQEGTHKVIRNGRHRNAHAPMLPPEEYKIGFRLVRTASYSNK